MIPLYDSNFKIAILLLTLHENWGILNLYNHISVIKPFQIYRNGVFSMGKIKGFLKRKQIEISLKRYFIDAMSAMAQGLFCTLLVGTILNTLGSEFNISFFTPFNQKHTA